MGIEPTPSAWKAEVLPLNYTRRDRCQPRPPRAYPKIGRLVEGGGFEPPKAEPSDLQSDPFSHSGTPPSARKHRGCHCRGEVLCCQGGERVFFYARTKER